ncbi:helix-turn-helix transcriptional regulator [Pseudoxanthomonas kaohsiungensis]|uniref:helix-turn-helix transcriptional regulator n=1 Tax=Pseudoxanthomonas TaxID=83618 RepID=UPI0035B19BE8
MLRFADVCRRTGLSKSQILRLMDKQGFPQPIKLCARANGWIESEITGWLRERIVRSRAKA